MTVEEMGASVLAQVGARFDGVTLLLVEIRDQVRAQNGRVATLERFTGNLDGRLGDVVERVRVIGADGHAGRNKVMELHGELATRIDGIVQMVESHADGCPARSVPSSTEQTVLTIGLVRWIATAIVGTIAAMLGLMKLLGKI